MEAGNDNLDANKLNEIKAEEKENEEAKAEASNIKQKILNSLPNNYDVLSFSGPIEEISLGGRVKQSNAFAVKVEKENKEIEILIFNKSAQQVASINEQNQIMLSEEAKEKLKEMIGKPGQQTKEQKKYYDFQKKYSLSQEEIDDLWVQVEEKEMPEDNKEKARNAKLAEALGVSEGDMLSIVEIKEQDTKTVLADKDKKYSQIFIIELKRDSAGRGDHDWVAVEAKADRFF